MSSHIIFLPAFLEPVGPWMLLFKYQGNPVILSFSCPTADVLRDSTERIHLLSAGTTPPPPASRLQGDPVLSPSPKSSVVANLNKYDYTLHIDLPLLKIIIIIIIIIITHFE